MKMNQQIRVTVKNDFLGNDVFWQGDAKDIKKIRNIPARETAKLVVKDGVKRVCGMWHVEMVNDA